MDMGLSRLDALRLRLLISQQRVLNEQYRCEVLQSAVNDLLSSSSDSGFVPVVETTPSASDADRPQDDVQISEPIVADSNLQSDGSTVTSSTAVDSDDLSSKLSDIHPDRSDVFSTDDTTPSAEHSTSYSTQDESNRGDTENIIVVTDSQVSSTEGSAPLAASKQPNHVQPKPVPAAQSLAIDVGAAESEVHEQNALFNATGITFPEAFTIAERPRPSPGASPSHPRTFSSALLSPPAATGRMRSQTTFAPSPRSSASLIFPPRPAISTENVVTAPAVIAPATRGPFKGRVVRCYEFLNRHRIFLLEGDYMREPCDALILGNVPYLLSPSEPTKKFLDKFPSFRDAASVFLSDRGQPSPGTCATLWPPTDDSLFHCLLFAIGPSTWTGDSASKQSVRSSVSAAFAECANMQYTRILMGPLTGGSFGADELSWLSTAQCVLDSVFAFINETKQYLVGEVNLDLALVERAGIGRDILEALLKKHAVRELDPDSVAFPVVNQDPEVDPSPFYNSGWQRFSPLPLEDESGQDIDSGFDVKANKHMIRAGTFEGLVRKLTHHIEFDSDALYSFLLTYRSFATPDLLFETLVRRYNSIPRNGLDKTTFGRFYKNKLLPIRLRVCQMIKTWVEFYPFDFAEKPELLLSVRSFADMAVSTDLKSSGESLRKAVDKVSLDIQEQRFLLENPVLTHALDGRSASQKLSFGQSSPSVAVDHLGFEEEMQLIAVSQRTDLLDWPVRDLARQVSVFEFRLFRAITPKEFLKQAWMKANKEELAPNILKLTDRFNRFSRWCAARVMQSSDVRERRAVFITLVNLAEECRKLNNMNAIFEIVAALNNAAVHRLKRTKEDLPSRTVTLLSKLEKLISREGSCRNLREALHQATPPCVPYLGMYLSDLTFVDEGNKDKVRDGMINFNKCRLLSHVIREVQIYQQTPYSFSVDEQVQSMLVDCDGVSDDELFARSLELEPRGS